MLGRAAVQSVRRMLLPLREGIGSGRSDKHKVGKLNTLSAAVL